MIETPRRPRAVEPKFGGALRDRVGGSFRGGPLGMWDGGVDQHREILTGVENEAPRPWVGGKISYANDREKLKPRI